MNFQSFPTKESRRELPSWWAAQFQVLVLGSAFFFTFDTAPLFCLRGPVDSSCLNNLFFWISTHLLKTVERRRAAFCAALVYFRHNSLSLHFIVQSNFSILVTSFV
jgi:hypothetical protein